MRMFCRVESCIFSVLFMQRGLFAIWFSLLLFGGGYSCSAQSFTYSPWERVRDLPANVIYTLFTDRDGFLWVGTTDGVFRYDGYQFHQFTIQDGLIDNDVFQMTQDSIGRIWFLTNKGWPCYYHAGRFYSGKNTEWLASIRPIKMAISIYVEPKGNKIWYASLDTVYAIEDNQVTKRIGAKVYGDSYAYFQKVIHWKGTVYLVHNVGYQSVVTNKEVHFTHKIKSVHNKVFHDGRTIYYFDNQLIRVWDLVDEEEVMVHTLAKGENFLCFLLHTKPDEFLINSMKQVYRLSGRTRNGLNPEPNIPVEMATVLHIDREGNRWMSSLTHGLWVQYRNEEPRSRKVNRPVLPKNEPCWSLSPTDQGYYAGFTHGAALIKKNQPKLDRFIILPVKDNRLRINKVIDVPGETWLVTSNELVAVKSGNRGFTVRLYAVKDAHIVGKHAYFATSTGLKYSPLDSTGLFPVSELNGIRFSRVVATTPDSVWMGGILGLKLRVKEQEIDRLPWTDSVVNGYVSSMIHHSSGAMMFATAEQGIGIVSQGKLYAIRQAGSIPLINVIQLREDKEGAVWVLTNQYLLRLKYFIQRQNLVTDWRDYTKAIDVGAKRIHAVLPIDDSLYLATDQGVFQHQLTDIRQNPITPLMRMEYLSAGTKTYFRPTDINLSSEQRYLRFRFVGIAYQAKGNIRYRYRLEPLDKSWNYTNEREVAYPFLNYGSYRFVVESSLPDGSWSEPAYTVVNIETPFTQTPWFWLAIAIPGMALLGLFFFLRFTALKARHQLQQETLLFEKKLAELELQALQLQMNPHFIFNAIYAIQGFYASGDKVVAKDYIARLASLVRMIFESGRKNQIPLEHEIRLLREYVGLFQLRMDVPITFYVDIDPRLQPSEVMIPPMLIQPIVENALQYGLAPLRSGAQLFIRFLQEGDHLHISIEDNGVGRAKSARMKLDTPKTSSGLRITEQRIQLLYREVPDFPVFEIADLNPTQENPGTIVHLRIPLEL